MTQRVEEWHRTGQFAVAEAEPHAWFWADDGTVQQGRRFTGAAIRERAKAIYTSFGRRVAESFGAAVFTVTDDELAERIDGMMREVTK